ncbi:MULTISPECIES: DUF1003 domain-containing protein [Sphingomonas]|jgi:uncharacterized membrane protein|uniref:DUF1003 domain-containing protein n=1 Tax=Sphingomonas hankookensis TaxID=563996 RepID=A0ABR5Y8Q7_9SPHN|nr:MULTISPECIES: DUF1003 domain-containing protein [Sphingomonas]KZE09210.1 hypothetical protein AVT10_06800 [Sphingomonas hankookensis]PZT95974.1 MAG: DUF1003 domain-containing protein [Sphingomonas sp.]WCP73135.1 DUF1003 domain-containing protein [Sphingomonas hankookensis]
MNTTIRFLTEPFRRTGSVRDPNTAFDDTMTLGERLADRVAAIGGSWGFITAFCLFLVGWSVLNTIILGTGAFDPFPFIFLNLMLSMLAALQAPIIMMSQNRQAAKDRLEARMDYETNLRAEAQINRLLEEVAAIRAELSCGARVRQRA